MMKIENKEGDSAQPYLKPVGKSKLSDSVTWILRLTLVWEYKSFTVLNDFPSRPYLLIFLPKDL